SGNTRSMSALGFLRSKYQECLDKHVGCRLQASPMAIYPSQIIDVGELEDNRIFLRNTQDSGNQGTYACLSHCWGQKQPFKLTNETKSMLQDGMLLSALPKTFQDAIFVTRSLGIRLLWIDSLCIFQDSGDDWETEASRMGDIYSQAACTIAATAAKDSDGGLFAERDPTVLRPRRIEANWTPNPDAATNERYAYPAAGLYWCDIAELWTQAVERAPLNSRAWVCQERHLSPRIMHFSDSQLFWECHECISCENYPSGLPHWAGPSWYHNSSVSRQNLHQLRLQEADLSREGSGSLLKRKLYFSWAVFRIHYTECVMTKEEDKLIAIHGIAQQLGQVLGDQLVAGLWSNRLIEELCWRKGSDLNEPPPPKLTKWRAPTWSWASSNARIWVSNTTRFHRKCKDKQIWSELENLDVRTKASGELEQASLRIRCK
ncbi:HET-domain-containing protein, partial [Plenodomus tracheiphilus IPT5]